MGNFYFRPNNRSAAREVQHSTGNEQVCSNYGLYKRGEKVVMRMAGVVTGICVLFYEPCRAFYGLKGRENIVSLN